MIQLFTSYLRNIAILIIFISFVGIILPNEKYKKYISIVLGLIVILAVFEPMAKYIKNPSLLLNISNSIINGTPVQSTVDTNALVKSDVKRNDLIKKNYEQGIKEHLKKELVTKKYDVIDLKVEIDKSLQLSGMDLIVSQSDETNKSNSFFRIESVQIKPISPLQKPLTENIESPEILDLKKLISNFYNLSVDNIHIRVQKK